MIVPLRSNAISDLLIVCGESKEEGKSTGATKRTGQRVLYSTRTTSNRVQLHGGEKNEERKEARREL